MLGKVLFVVHCVVAAWGLVGLVEWLATRVPWPPLTNPDLPRGVLLVHWLAMIGAGSLFLVGYATQWSRTPIAMVGAYGVLAAICALETFSHLTSPNRFVAMGVEYATYAGILFLLFRVESLRTYFGG